MTVVPSCIWIVGGEGSNGSVRTTNTTLTISRTENLTLTLYASNVGDAYAHLLYYAVVFDCDSPLNYTLVEIPFSSTIVLKPNEGTTFEYLFSPLHIPPDVISSTNSFNLTFVLGSVETTIQKVIPAKFED